MSGTVMFPYAGFPNPQDPYGVYQIGVPPVVGMQPPLILQVSKCGGQWSHGVWALVGMMRQGLTLMVQGTPSPMQPMQQYFDGSMLHVPQAGPIPARPAQSVAGRTNRSQRPRESEGQITEDQMKQIKKKLIPGSSSLSWCLLALSLSLPPSLSRSLSLSLLLCV
jgi:hypothetical protein